MKRFRSDGRQSTPRLIVRLLLGAALLFAGLGHVSFAREAFRAQVPAWVPLDVDVVVVASGIVELALGAALIALPRWRILVGLVVAAFFVAVFPGNIAQYVTGTDSFGLDDDPSRFIRLLFQPVLVLVALWATDASLWLRGLVRARRARSD